MIALALALAVQTAPMSDMQVAKYGELAYTFGLCERYAFPHVKDRVVKEMKPETETAFSRFLWRLYVRGRADAQDVNMSIEQCTEVTGHMLEELDQ